MFKKLKQRIEEGEQPAKILSSTPKKNVNSSKPRRIITKAPINTTTTANVCNRNNVNKTLNNVNKPFSNNVRTSQSISNVRPLKPPSGAHIISTNANNVKGFNTGTIQNSKNENKWEKRRRSSFASSRESLISVDSGATTGTAGFSRISYGGGSSSVEDTPCHFESPVVLETLRDSATKEEVLTELTKKNEKVRTLQNKINELSTAYVEQGKQRDRLEEALENIRNEMLSRSQTTTINNENFQAMQEEYEQKLIIKDQQIKDYKNKHQESLHSAAELVAKSMKVEHIEKEYKAQKLEFETLQRTLNDLSSDRSKYEMQIKQLSMQLGTSEKDNLALKSELSDIIDELTQKSRMVETLQCSLDKAHEEARSTQQTYNLLKAKAMSDNDERDTEITMWKNKIHDLQQKLDGSQLSENDQIKVLEKENRGLEKKLQDAREQVSTVRSESNDQINSLNALIAGFEKQLEDAKSTSKNVESETHFIDTLRNKVRELEQKCLTLKTEKMELEIVADKSSFLESQNNLLDARFKETVERLEADRSHLEEKVRSLQMDSHKTSYRQDHTNRRKIEQLETKVEDQDRIISEYQERMKVVVAEKETVVAQIKRKEEENKKASGCLEEAMVSTNELKKEISSLEEALREKDDLIRYIKETRDERFSSREKDLIQRDEEIEELQRVLQDRDDELAAVSEQFHKLQDSSRSPRLSKSQSTSSEIELQKTVARLTDQIQALENEKQENKNSEIEKRTLKSELDEANKKIRTMQQNLADVKKHYQKEKEKDKKLDASQVASNNKDTHNEDDLKLKKVKEKQDFLDVNFKYLKHVILKYMCGANDQSRQLVGVIGHLLQFTPRESSIVRDCFEWKLPIEK